MCVLLLLCTKHWRVDFGKAWYSTVVLDSCSKMAWTYHLSLFGAAQIQHKCCVLCVAYSPCLLHTALLDIHLQWQCTVCSCTGNAQGIFLEGLRVSSWSWAWKHECCGSVDCRLLSSCNASTKQTSYNCLPGYSFTAQAGLVTLPCKYFNCFCWKTLFSKIRIEKYYILPSLKTRELLTWQCDFGRTWHQMYDWEPMLSSQPSHKTRELLTWQCNFGMMLAQNV